jgi:hypothetical protein
VGLPFREAVQFCLTSSKNKAQNICDCLRICRKTQI